MTVKLQGKLDFKDWTWADSLSLGGAREEIRALFDGLMDKVDEAADKITDDAGERIAATLNHVLLEDAKNGEMLASVFAYEPDGNDDAFNAVVTKGGPITRPFLSLPLLGDNLFINIDLAETFERLANDEDGWTDEKLRWAEYFKTLAARFERAAAEEE